MAGVAAALLIVAPNDASAFCRSTTCKQNCEYALQGSFCELTGNKLSWRGCVSYSLDVTNLDSSEVAEKLALVDSAFRAWEGVTCADGRRPSIQVQHAGEVLCDHIEYNFAQGNANVITFRTDWPYRSEQDQLGLTTVTYDPRTGELLDADMELNFSDEDKIEFTSDPTVGAGSWDLQSVITHEVGHFLGFDHVPQGSTDSVMFPYYDPDGDNDLRAVRPDDIAGICEAYPPSPTQSTADCTPKNGFSPECALSPAVGGWCAAGPSRLSRHGVESALATSLVLGVLALRRRRRQRG